MLPTAEPPSCRPSSTWHTRGRQEPRSPNCSSEGRSSRSTSSPWLTNPRLRSLFPLISHGSLQFGRCTHAPWSDDVPHLLPQFAGGWSARLAFPTAAVRQWKGPRICFPDRGTDRSVQLRQQEGQLSDRVPDRQGLLTRSHAHS
ncbi:DUF6193 family natural product biosynthesis protein [Streptomyces sp. NPDC048442]|uniref:DUF6193 family natural product biosynthesis protein n=1 Tax=Streptomyces sp. NPDC048442 TaxID=3154823 RepID=UPI003430F238